MGLFDGLPLSYKSKYLKDFSHRKKVRKSYTPKEAAVLAPQYLKQVEDCTNLVNTTIKPDVYFKRYDLMVSCLVELKKMQSVIKFKGKKPSSYLKEVLHTRDKQLEFFMNRIYDAAVQKITSLSTAKAKENHIIKFTETMDSIRCELTPELNAKIDDMILALKEL